jgi:hypothetical protein
LRYNNFTKRGTIIPAKAGKSRQLTRPQHGFVRYTELYDKPDSGLRRNDGVTGIIASFSAHDNIMEIEQLNALANQLQDLGLRSAELRRYL